MQPKNRGTTSTARPSGPRRTERLEVGRKGGGSSCSSRHLDQICLKCQEFGLKHFKPKPWRLVLRFKKLFLFLSGRQCQGKAKTEGRMLGSSHNFYFLFFYRNGFKQRPWRYRSKCGLGMYFASTRNKTSAWTGNRHDRGMTFDLHVLF